MENHGKRWLISDLSHLQKSILLGRDICEIAAELGRAPKACAAKAYNYVISRSRESDKLRIGAYLSDLPSDIFDLETAKRFSDQGRYKAVRKC